MLNAVYELGLLSDVQASPQEMYAKDKGSKVLFINFKTSDEGHTEWDVDIEDFDIYKASEKYLYDPNMGKGQEPNIMPTMSFEKTQEETKQSVTKGIKKVLSWLSKGEGIPQEVQIAMKKLEDEQDELAENIAEKAVDIAPNKKTKLKLSIKINGKYVGEYDRLKRVFQKLARKRISGNLHKGTCAFCGETKDNIIEKASGVYRFYTVDKLGFVPKLTEKEAWKTFPVCADCYMVFKKAKEEIIEPLLKYKFYGVSYYVIPEIVSKDEVGKEELREILNEIKGHRNEKLSDKYKRLLTSNEEEIFDILGDKQKLVYHLLFIKKESSAEKIVLLIEDVPPRRIQQLFDAKEKVENVFHNEKFNVEYHLGHQKKFFGDDVSKDKTFFELIDAIFKGRQVDFEFLLHRFMLKIRSAILQNGGLWKREKSKGTGSSASPQSLILSALMNIFFLKELSLISLNQLNPLIMNGKLDSYFQKYGDMFNDPVRRGLFLLGALTQYLMLRQQHDRGSAPFLKKLKGFKMNKQDFLGLLPQIENKLAAYGWNSKFTQTLKEEIAKNLLQANNWDMSIDEMNFLFTAGMYLYDDLKNFLKAEEQQEQIV
ncbi:MAG: TIGR02556 family CRISPR-associated protein [Chlorobi bacterium]|nr:TIGR02556 family CRISPR-associated protein [Chlorobiota bacterium]